MFQNGLQIIVIILEDDSDNDYGRLFRNLLSFGPVTPEITMLEIVIFATIRQKMAYRTGYIKMYWTIFTKFYGRRWWK